MKDMHPQNDPRQLSDLLRGAVPESPDPAGRADEVVRRSRRATRRRGTASAFVVGAVALAVVVGPHLIAGSPVSDSAGSTDTTAAAARLSHPFTCPSVDQTPAKVTTPATDTIATGAVLARICPALGSHLTRWSAPVDALTTNVDVVAEAYDHLPPGQALPCPATLAPTTGFSVTFEYPDGHLVRVSADSNDIGGCSLIGIDGRNGLGRADAGTVMTSYFSQLQHQRTTRTPPAAATSTALTCPGVPSGFVPGLIPPANRLDLTTAVICLFPGTKPVPRHPFPLSRAQALAIDNDYPTHLSKQRMAPCLGPLGPTYIFGETDWGDKVAIAGDCVAWSRGGLFWTPSASVQAMLNRVITR